MSLQAREFVRRSGIDVISSDSNNNNNYSRELEKYMRNQEVIKARERRQTSSRTPPSTRMAPNSQVPPRLQQNLISNRKYSPLANEFADVNTNKLVNNALKADINTSEFEDFEPDATAINELFADVPSSGLEISKLNPGMFNALVDSGFNQKDTIVDIKKILSKRPLVRTMVGNGLYIDTIEIIGRYGQNKAGVSHTRKFGLKGNMNIMYVSAQFKMILSNAMGETKGLSVNIYKNGKIRFSGGFLGTDISNQPDIIRRFVVDNYTTKEAFYYNPFKYNNLSGQFRVNGNFKPESLTQITSNSRKYGFISGSYEPELSPFLYLEGNGFKLSLAISGNVQILGVQNPGDMLKKYDFAKTFVKTLYNEGKIVVTGKFNQGIKAKAKAKAKAKPKPKPKAKNKALNNNEIKAVNIDMAKCKRTMNAEQLKNLARKLGVTNFRIKGVNGRTKKATKNDICKKISNITGKKSVSVKNTNTGKNIPLPGSNKTFKVGRRLCTSKPKKELLRVAKMMKVSVNDKDTVPIICRKIQKARNNIAAAPKPKPLSPKALLQKKKNEKKENNNLAKNLNRALAVERRKINDTSIKKRLTSLYGSKWMNRYKPNLNQDVRNVKTAINKLNNKSRNKKLGVPFLKDVKNIEDRMVRNWKLSRRNQLEKAYLTKQVNVSGINMNSRNAYRRSAIDYMKSLLNNKKQPTERRMKIHKENWKKFTNNMRARPNVGGANARIERL